MKLSPAGLDLIISSEGKLKPLGDGRYIAYRCPANVWTIYTGCTIGVHEGMIVTEDQGKAMFRAELEKHEAAVTRLVTVDLTQSQFDALVSFSYNVGSGALTSSTLLAKLNRGDYPGACKEFAKWDKAKVKNKKTGKIESVALRGLTIRRSNEMALFATRDEAPTIAQAVEVPKEPMSTTQTVAATATVATGAVPAVQALTSAAPPTDWLANAQAWREASTGIQEFGSWMIASPKAVLIILVAGSVAWAGRKFKPEWFGAQP